MTLVLASSPTWAETKTSHSVSAQQHKHDKGFWNSLSRSWLTREQIDLLNLAHRIGMESDGEAHAAMLQSILMQESHAGRFGRIGDTNADIGKRSYGVMQIKLITANDVLARYPSMGRFKTEEDLIIKLVTDDYFNIQIASRHLLLLRNHTKREAQAVMAYNTGLSKALKHWYPEKFRYVRKVKRYLTHVVTPFNRRYGNEIQTVALLDG
ncbi:MAG: hypothetical protein HUJ29_03730 [Gammaproteobacteria bacterium]|nr:hypothetical protein [Gammaproteobacteria bacterium]